MIPQPDPPLPVVHDLQLLSLPLPQPAAGKLLRVVEQEWAAPAEADQAHGENDRETVGLLQPLGPERGRGQLRQNSSTEGRVGGGGEGIRIII